jgi:predicted nucleic acid-binding protein
VCLLVDTSVWSLALRRDAPPDVPETRELRDALAGGEIVATTGVILQELLQGVVPQRARTQIIEMFAVLEYRVRG